MRCNRTGIALSSLVASLIAFSVGRQAMCDEVPSDERLHIVFEDMQHIRDVQSLIDAATHIAGVLVDEKPGSGWLLRVKPNSSMLTLMRDAEVVGFKTVLNTPAELKISLKRELKWRRLVNLRNPNSDGTVGVEFHWVPVEVKRKPDGSKQYVRDIVKDGAVSPRIGDSVVLEVRNTGEVNAYVAVLDLEPDGTYSLLIPPADSGEKEIFIPADRSWHRATGADGTPRIFHISLPVGLDITKAIATTTKMDWSMLAEPPTESPLSALLSGMGSALPEKASQKFQWATATLKMKIGYKQTLHVLAIGSNTSNSAGLPSRFAVEGAKDVDQTFMKMTGRAFDEVQANLLVGSYATKVNIEAAFNRLASASRPWDTFVLYYAGPKSITPLDLAGWTSKISARKQLFIRKYLTSVRHQTALDGQTNQHSPFAKAMLDVLQEYAGKPQSLTADSLRSLIWAKTTDSINQKPLLGDFGQGKVDGDFVLVPKAAATAH